MADEKFSAKFDVKASALPDRILKDFENVKHPSAIKLLPVTKAQELPQEKNKSNGLTMLELNQFVSDPFWVKIRRTLMVFAILLFLGLFIASILIIVYTPSCIDGRNATQTDCVVILWLLAMTLLCLLLIRLLSITKNINKKRIPSK